MVAIHFEEQAVSICSGWDWGDGVFEWHLVSTVMEDGSVNIRRFYVTEYSV